MNKDKIYTLLAEKLGAPTSARFLALMEGMLKPEEARICLELYYPATVPELASRLGLNESDLERKLQNLVDRGFLTRGKTQFAFHTTLLGFHHDLADTGVHSGRHAMSKKVKKLWADFFYNEWSTNWVEMAAERKKAGLPGNMITPAIGALEMSPNIRPEEILPQENWKLQIQIAKHRIVAPCGCRTLWGNCRHPVMTCFACFDNSRGEYYLNKPGRLLKELSLDETLAIVRNNEAEGLVHWGVCYCCTDACEMLYSYKKMNRTDLVEANRFVAAVNEDLCSGCQKCLERCPFGAVEMEKLPNSKKQKAKIIADKCKGCGVCVVGCKHKAMRLEIVRPPEYLANYLRQRPAPPKAEPEPGSTRKIAVGAYGGYYELK